MRSGPDNAMLLADSSEDEFWSHEAHISTISVVWVHRVQCLFIYRLIINEENKNLQVTVKTAALSSVYFTARFILWFVFVSYLNTVYTHHLYCFMIFWSKGLNIEISWIYIFNCKYLWRCHPNKDRKNLIYKIEVFIVRHSSSTSVCVISSFWNESNKKKQRITCISFVNVISDGKSSLPNDICVWWSGELSFKAVKFVLFGNERLWNTIRAQKAMLPSWMYLIN